MWGTMAPIAVSRHALMSRTPRPRTPSKHGVCRPPIGVSSHTPMPQTNHHPQEINTRGALASHACFTARVDSHGHTHSRSINTWGILASHCLSGHTLIARSTHTPIVSDHGGCWPPTSV